MSKKARDAFKMVSTGVAVVAGGITIFWLGLHTGMTIEYLALKCDELKKETNSDEQTESSEEA